MFLSRLFLSSLRLRAEADCARASKLAIFAAPPQSASADQSNCTDSAIARLALFSTGRRMRWAAMKRQIILISIRLVSALSGDRFVIEVAVGVVAAWQCAFHRQAAWSGFHGRKT
jgi:hypothetical protein